MCEMCALPVWSWRFTIARSRALSMDILVVVKLLVRGVTASVYGGEDVVVVQVHVLDRRPSKRPTAGGGVGLLESCEWSGTLWAD